MADTAVDKGTHIHILAQAETQQADLQQNHLKMEVRRIQVYHNRIQVSQTQSPGVQNQKVFSCLLA